MNHSGNVNHRSGVLENFISFSNQQWSNFLTLLNNANSSQSNKFSGHGKFVDYDLGYSDHMTGRII